MIATLHLPTTLMGQPLSACDMPTALAQLLALHGKSVADPIGEIWIDSGPFPVTLQNEFEEAAGYRFDWGWVIPSMPRWYIEEGKSAPVAWRFVPVALWQEFAQTQRLLETVPALLQVAARPVLDCIVQAEHSSFGPWIFEDYPTFDVPYESLERTLPHDLCTFWPHQSTEANGAALARWIEDDFLPQRLPPLLRLLKSAALARIHVLEKRPVVPSMDGKS